MKKILLCCLVLLLVVSVSSAFAGTKKGDLELGVYATVMNIDTGGSDSDTVLIAVSAASFLTDSLSLGGAVSLMSNDDGTNEFSMMTLSAEPNFHFGSGTVVPYAGAHLGLTFWDTGNDDGTEVAYGVQGGIKSFLSENTALDTQLRLTTADMDGTDVDTTEIRVGLNIYF